MARIRTIKPEFPHSESMGRVSRDARLTFIQLWTLADDSGRLRGNSRMLASLLFPYDDDAKKLIEGWLGELEGENCIVRYVVDDTSYIQVCNWLSHQKIDKPSASKLPPFDESSRKVAKPREPSSGDLDQGSGSRTKDQGRDQDQLPVELKLDGGPVERVFEHWRSEFGHSKASLDPKRRRVITAALKSFEEPILRQAISGYRNSPHHMGENEQRTVYDDIELFLRDAKHVEAGLRFARGPPAPATSPVEQARQKLRERMNGHGRVVSEQSGSASDSSVGPTVGFLR